MPIYRFAGLDFEIEYLIPGTGEMLLPYLCRTGDPIKKISPSADEIAEAAGRMKLSRQIAESLIIHRAVSSELILYGGFMLHASAIRLNGGAYCFVARSGVGKSTHAAGWKALLGDAVEYINDDKPFVRKEDGIFSVYGSPWTGKHRLGDNISANLSALCFIVRDTDNYVLPLDKNDALLRLFDQTLRPADSAHITALLDSLGDFVASAPIYEIHCTADITAAKAATAVVLKGKK